MMGKTAAGCLGIGGLMCSLAGAAIASSAVSHNPSEDWHADLWRYGGGVMIVVGLVAFFVGCMVFSRRN